MPPDGFGPNSQWGRFVAWLWQRYADRLTAFEVVNEPNGQLWPQRSQVATEDFNTRWGAADTTLLTGPAVAEMMRTVDALARRHANPPLLLAPSAPTASPPTPRERRRGHTTSDVDDRGPVRTLPARRRWKRAASRLGMDGSGRSTTTSMPSARCSRRSSFAACSARVGGRDAVSTADRSCGAPRAAAGWRRCRRASAPRSAAISPTDERKQQQALVVTESLSRHHYAKGAGAGIGMLTQYTTYADGSTAACSTSVVLGGAARPALKAWSDVPEYVAAPVQRAAWRPQL